MGTKEEEIITVQYTGGVTDSPVGITKVRINQ